MEEQGASKGGRSQPVSAGMPAKRGALLNNGREER